MTGTTHFRAMLLTLVLGAGVLLPAGRLTADVRALLVEANAEQGFHYPWYLLVPDSVPEGTPAYLLVEPNNTGTAADDFEEHRPRARRLAERSHASRIAVRLGAPLLVPVFPRPRTGWRRYTHALDRDTMLIEEDPLRRLDEQLIAMIRRARVLLRTRGIETHPRVFMHGFSASGNFSNRFAALHPRLVKAVASGGVNATPILPAAEFDGRALPYPVGVADLETITGAPFDTAAYRRVPQYIYMGGLDRNDTVPYRDAWSENEAELVKTVLGDPMMPDRWTNVQKLLRDLESPAQCVTYTGVAHTIKDEMLDDIVRFFRANSGAALVRIEPHAYPAPD